jgi:hypothetical protein
MAAMIGQAISHFRILEKLGEDTQLKRTAALEFLTP